MCASTLPGSITAVGVSKMSRCITKIKTVATFKKCDRFAVKIAGVSSTATPACKRPLGRGAIAPLTIATTCAGLRHDGETIGPRLGSVKATDYTDEHSSERDFALFVFTRVICGLCLTGHHYRSKNGKTRVRPSICGRRSSARFGSNKRRSLITGGTCRSTSQLVD